MNTATPWRQWPLGTGPGRVRIGHDDLDVDDHGRVRCPRCRGLEPVWTAGEHVEGVRAFGRQTVRPVDDEDDWRAASALPPAPNLRPRRADPWAVGW